MNKSTSINDSFLKSIPNGKRRSIARIPRTVIVYAEGWDIALPLIDIPTDLAQGVTGYFKTVYFTPEEDLIDTTSSRTCGILEEVP